MPAPEEVTDRTCSRSLGEDRIHLVRSPAATADGVVYVATVNAPATLEPNKTAYFGGSIGTMEGEVVAIGASTGKHRWDTKISGDPLGGATVVNDLVLTGTYQGQVVALDLTTGRNVAIIDVGKRHRRLARCSRRPPPRANRYGRWLRQAHRLANSWIALTRFSGVR